MDQIQNNYDLGLTEEKHLVSDVKKQFAIARLGQLALISEDLNYFNNEVCKTITELMDIELVKILELTTDQTSLNLISGVGWKEFYVGKASVGVDFSSQAGYTLLQKEPVVVSDFKDENRFRSPKLLREHAVKSGISIIISGKDKPFGILGVHSLNERNYTQDDINFVHSIANICSTAFMLFERLKSSGSN